jgi:hypothetical protein
VEVARQMSMPSNENLIVIADQWEELFRVEQGAQKEDVENDKAAFVKLLIEASRQREVNIYVALTMRSDYLDDCSQFWDLPEAINEGQYLIPRLTLDQRRDAIIGPAGVGGARITPRLVNRLINDVGDNPDQLPILQHALMRTWDKWKEENRPEEPVDLRHYEAIGGMAEALSLHADEASYELTAELYVVAEKTFKALTEIDDDNREVRRQITLGEICLIANAQEKDVVAIIDTFRRPGRSFLMPPADRALNSDSLIDISHESLIRVWKQLRDWADEESQSARQYQRLAETARLYYDRKERLLLNPALQLALDWRENNKPNTAWARRYHSGWRADSGSKDAKQKQLEVEKEFNLVLKYLDDSEKQRAASATRRRLGIAGLILLTLFAFVAAGLALQQKNVAQEQSLVAGNNAQKVRQLLYLSDMTLASLIFREKDRTRGYELLNNQLPASGNPDLRGFEWYYLWRLYHNESATLNGHTGYVLSEAFSPDGRTLAIGSEDGDIKLFFAATDQEVEAQRNK